MTDHDILFKIFAACVPIILAALGHQYNVIRAIQRQQDKCIELLAKDRE